VNSETKIRKHDKPATLRDIPIGEELRGATREKDGKLMAVSLYIGSKELDVKETHAAKTTKPEKK
jgi:hypothetical protein